MKTRRAPVRLAVALGALCLLGAGCATGPGSTSAEALDIPFTRFVLDNGLTLIVHEDPKAPIVAVNVWYHVGSKNEKPGKTGFAHLFEHLMFNGSENHDDDYFGPFDRVGATSMNGTTNADRTNYFQTVPAPALDMALWMESDRMGHLLGAIDQAKLDEQRDVVKNEKRQNENQPYGQVYNHLVANTYPKGHPYSWPTIGSMEDLDAASLNDVKQWFKDYYGAGNAVITIAGAVDAEQVRQKVEQYFGDIPAGPPVSQQVRWVAKRNGSRRQVIRDRVPQARIIKSWNVPEIGSTEAQHLDLAGGVLASGKTSRLYQRLVYEERVASDVSAYVWPREIAGLFVISATALPGQDLSAVEAILDEEMARFLADGPEKDELARLKMEERSGFIRATERIGGHRGKADLLASGQVYEGRPDAYKDDLRTIAEATTQDVHRTALEWLSDGVYVLEVHPYPEHITTGVDVDRSAIPSGGEPPVVTFPEFSRSRLSSGLEVLVAERHAVPVVDFQLLVDAGYAADQFASEGTANLTLGILDEGTETRTALEISEQLRLLGAELYTGSDLDTSSVSLSALEENLDASLEIFADVIRNPAFEQDDFERLQQQQLAGIQREKVTPRAMALRVFPQLLYGPGHAYGIPFTGSGTEAAVAALRPADLRAFHETWFKPDNATLVVVGDTTAEEIIPKLEALFAGWQAGETPQKNLANVAHRDATTVYLMDRPGSIQTIIAAGHIAPPKANPHEVAIEAMNEVLGASFSSRINMNLREDKNWAYGAHSFVLSARGQRPFMVFAPVQTDKSAAAMAEIQRELTDIIGPRPPAPDELARAKDKRILTLPGRWETSAAVASSISAIVRFGFPDDYWSTYPDRVRGLTLQSVEEAAQELIHPHQLIWVVVGDRAVIEDEIRALGLGELTVLDADGEPLNADSVATEEAKTTP